MERGFKAFPITLEGFKIGDCKTYAYTKVQTDIQIIEMLLNTKSVEDGHILSVSASRNSHNSRRKCEAYQ